jgi:predicted metal-dependent HD superfamily phosphohydrolase
VSGVLEWPDPIGTAALRQRWSELCGRFGAPSDVVDRAWLHVERAYADHRRRYHTLEHLGEVLALIEVLAGGTPSPAVEFAGWLHDLVYDPARSDNEVASANWAVEHLPALGVDGATVAETRELIEMTVTHDAAESDEQATTLADADLAILGSPSERYERYAAAVRAEYSDFDDAAWRDGRARVLEALLARPHLFHHPSLRRWEERARRNMRSELAELGRSVP